MPPIRILVDSFADQELTNAQMINAREIVSRLDPDRFAVKMFDRGAPDAKVAERRNTRLVRLPPRLQTAPILAQFLCGDQDIVFYLKASPAARWFMKLRSRRPRSMVIGSIESQTDWKDETMTPEVIHLIEQTVLRSDRLYSNSDFVRRSLERNYGIKSSVIPTGVDTEFLTPDWERPTNVRPRVLFVGSFRLFKGPHVVLDAAQRFPAADFVLVGDGVLGEELRKRGQSLKNVLFAGSLGRSEVREQYRSADIFLFPSRWEGSPRVLLEAAACGLPVIARRDYEPESVVPGESGLLAADDEELLAGLEKMLANRELRLQFGRAGRAHIIRFNWDAITREWEEAFTNAALEAKTR